MNIPYEQSKNIIFGNSHATNVFESGEVELKFNKTDFKQVLKSDQYVISKNSVFMGKGYAWHV